MTSTFPDSLIPGYDAARLRTLHQFQIVNTTPEPIFDSYVTWIAQLFNAPIALISLVDADYVWFKAVTGVNGVAGLPRNESMCSAAILATDQVVVTDYKPENCNLIKPDVAQANGLNFYAGAALIASDDSRLGMLAVIDKEARSVSAAEVTALTCLAELVSKTIELRSRYLLAEQPGEWEDAQHQLAQALDDNAALARYFTTRNSRIDLNNPEVAQPIMKRLGSVAKVLERRLESTEFTS
jgi:GAF domain-containing protein